MDKIDKTQNQSALLPYVGPKKKKFANHFTAHVKCYSILHYTYCKHHVCYKTKSRLTCKDTGFSDHSEVLKEKLAVPVLSVVRVTLTSFPPLSA